MRCIKCDCVWPLCLLLYMVTMCYLRQDCGLSHSDSLALIYGDLKKNHIIFPNCTFHPGVLVPTACRTSWFGIKTAGFRISLLPLPMWHGGFATITRLWINVDPVFQSIGPTIIQCIPFGGLLFFAGWIFPIHGLIPGSVDDTYYKQAPGVAPVAIWCWDSVADGGPTSNRHWVNALSLVDRLPTRRKSEDKLSNKRQQYDFDMRPVGCAWGVKVHK